MQGFSLDYPCNISPLHIPLKLSISYAEFDTTIMDNIERNVIIRSKAAKHAIEVGIEWTKQT
jgi:hypothetical protein